MSSTHFHDFKTVEIPCCKPFEVSVFKDYVIRRCPMCHKEYRVWLENDIPFFAAASVYRKNSYLKRSGKPLLPLV